MSENLQIQSPSFGRIERESGLQTRNGIRLLWMVLNDVFARFTKLKNDLTVGILRSELSADPPNPEEGHWVIWMGDGTGSGDDGDVLLKVTAAGATKTATIVDFSAI